MLTICFSAAAAEPEAELPRIADERILLRTVCGDIVMALYPDVAPGHVAQMLKLTRLGVFDLTHFVRVEPGFLIQIADAQDRPVAFNLEQKNAIHKLKHEFSSLKHVRGALNFGHYDNDPDSAETSFCIFLNDAPHLDGKYTIFGRIESGMDVVDKLASTPLVVDPFSKQKTHPAARLTVLKAEVMTEAELKNVKLQGPHDLPPEMLPPPEEKLKGGGGFSNLDDAVRLIVVGAGLIVVVALIGYLVANHFEPGVLLIFNLVNALIAGVVFFMYIKASGMVMHSDESLVLNDRLDRPSTNVILCAIGTLVLMGVVGSLIVRRRAPKMLVSFNLINVLIGGFLVFALVAPLAPSNSTLALGLFLGLISVLKLMSQFET